MILFCASDAGGAKELLPVALEARRRGDVFMILASETTKHFCTEYGLDAVVRKLLSVEEAREFLRSYDITVLVAGTTGTLSNERLLTQAAVRIGMPSIVVLDEWYGYAQRFSENGEPVYLPTMICVQDELSKKRAVEEGIPESILHITGSPALALLAKQAEQFAHTPPQVPSSVDALGGNPSILFLSERVAYAYGSALGESGVIGSFLGYDEEQVRRDMAKALLMYDKPVCVLEKLHPAELSKSSPANLAEHIEWRIIPNTDPVVPLLWHCDHIVGMTSKALLEAAVLGRKPLSYQPNALNDPAMMCTAVALGAANALLNPNNLHAVLKQELERGRSNNTPMHLTCSDPSSALNVFLAVESLK